MGWLHKKQKAPLVPGRDRVPAATRSARPVYSYYAGRTASDARNAPVQPRTATQTSGPVRRRHRAFLSLYGVIVSLCTVVAVVCVVKLLAISPNSKVIMSASTNYPVSQSATEAYTKAANELLRSSILNRSKLTLNTNGIAKSLRKQFPELVSVVVTTPLVGNRPIIYVSSSKPNFTLKTESGLYSMDAKGYVLARLTAPADGLTLLTEASARKPVPGSQYLASSTASFCVAVVYELEQKGIPLSRLDLPTTAPYELDAYVAGKPYYIRFNLQADVMQQSGAAIATIKQLGTSTPQQYLDVRVSERAYYK